MAVSKKQQACVARYTKSHYDDIKIRVKKGERDKLQTLAAEQGMSLNAFIIAAIERYVEQLNKTTWFAFLFPYRPYTPNAWGSERNNNCYVEFVFVSFAFLLLRKISNRKAKGGRRTHFLIKHQDLWTKRNRLSECEWLLTFNYLKLLNFKLFTRSLRNKEKYAHTRPFISRICRSPPLLCKIREGDGLCYGGEFCPISKTDIVTPTKNAVNRFVMRNTAFSIFRHF